MRILVDYLKDIRTEYVADLKLHNYRTEEASFNLGLRTAIIPKYVKGLCIVAVRVLNETEVKIFKIYLKNNTEIIEFYDYIGDVTDDKMNFYWKPIDYKSRLAWLDKNINKLEAELKMMGNG